MSTRSLPAFVALILLMSGCESALPHQTVVTESPWEEFAEAKESYDRIEINRTTQEQLHELGFHPFRNDNVAILSYMDVYEIFVPNASRTLEETPEGVQLCIESRDRCNGMRQLVMYEEDREYGNFWSNLFQFRIREERAGWLFESTLVLVDDVVVYKLWEGNPAILKRKDKVQPLGPFNDIDFDVKLRFP